MGQELEMASKSLGEGVNRSSEKEEAKEVENNLFNGYRRFNGKPNPDDYLPVTGSRNGRWWYSTFHNTTAMIGAGVLAFPFSMAYLRWEGGLLALVGSWIITLYTLWQMVEMHEMIPGKRFDRYHELGQEAFGEKLGLWIVVPQQLMVEMAVDIVYMITGGFSLRKFHQLIKCPCHGPNCEYNQLSPIGLPKKNCNEMGPSVWIIIFSSAHFVLAQLPNFNSISGLSLAAAVMSLCYTIIAWSDIAARGKQNPINGQVSGSFYGTPFTTNANLVFEAMNALGTISFAFAGHNVVLEIQATLPSTPNKPSKISMWRGVKWAYGLVALCYFPVAIAGYWAYGKHIVDHSHSGNILVILDRPTWLIAVANMMVVIHLTGSYQVYAMPVYDLLEITLVKKLHFRRSAFLRICTRSSYVFLTAFVACTLPFFGDLLGFFGGFAFAPSSYFLPCIIWLRLKKPRRFGWSWCINWILIVLGVVLGIVSTIGGLRNIITDAKDFEFYP